MSPFLFLVLGLVVLCGAVVAAPAEDGPRRVLVLHSFRNSLPVNTDWHAGLVRGFTTATDLQIEIDIEAPDLSRFREADYVSNLLGIYRHKYRDQQPHLLIPTYTHALKFLLDNGEELFPGVPVVFLGADNRFVAGQQLAPHITGIATHPDIAGTLELALHVHPDTRRVAVIVGSDNFSKQLENDARQAFQPYAGRVEFMWLQGMPLTELTETISRLPEQTVILYLLQLQDRTGKTYVPVNSMRQLSSVTKVPIYGLWDTLLEHGIIGGRLVTIENDGFQAANMALRIFRGEAPAAVPVVHREGNSTIFHGMELVRWNINEDRLPAGSQVVHRQISFWGENKNGIIIAGLVIGLQGLLITALLLNRARLRQTRTALLLESDQREQAETVASNQRRRLAKFSKERSLGAMATGIAHEINQPLIAIQNYAKAAKQRLESNVDQKIKLNDLLEKVDQQAGRAGNIIQRIRALVSTNETVLLPVPLYSVIEEVIRMVKPESEIQGCRIAFRPAADLCVVLMDELQIQLVLVNLLQNAVQCMESTEAVTDKVISIKVRRLNDREVQVSVADRGPDIPPDGVEQLFEPFISNKVDGMGLGLSICRAIIEAHGGEIVYTPNPSGGTIFQFTLRLAEV